MNSIPREFGGEYIKNLLFLDQFDMASTFINNNNNLDDEEKAEYRLGILLMQNKWTDADNFTRGNSSVLTLSPISSDLDRILKSGLNIKYKKPLLAAAMSTVIPGSGKIYTSR